MPEGVIVRGALFLLLICLSGCSNNIDNSMTDEDLISEFSEHKQQYEKLREMITSDAGKLNKFEVSDSRLGEYRLYENGWAKVYGTYVQLEVILAEYSLTLTRYREYLNLLSTIGASTVEMYNGSVSIVIASSGFVFGGCLTQIHYDPEKLKIKKPSWAQVYQQAQFNDHWGGETKCN